MKVSDIHMLEISRLYCAKWRLLYSPLELDKMVVNDVDHMQNATEDEKRHAFLVTWRERKGCGATYEKLIHALMKIGRQEDAEGIQKLIASKT